MSKKRVLYDIEVSPNYFLLGFLFPNGKIKQFDAFGKSKSLTKKKKKQIHKIIKKNTLIGFNNHSYDDPMTALILEGVPTDIIFEASSFIIEERIQRWRAHDELGVERVVKDSIDIMEVAKGQASLKLYGARIHSKKVQDLPYDPKLVLKKKQAQKIALYNINDLYLTRDVYTKLLPKLNLREGITKQYGVDVMSKSDAQIAEAIFKVELTKMGIKVKKAKGNVLVVNTSKKDLKRLYTRLTEELIRYDDKDKLIKQSAEKLKVIEKRYNIVLTRSMTDEQFIETMKEGVSNVVARIKDKSLPVVRYEPPSPVKFKSERLSKIVERLSMELILMDAGGSPILPKWLEDEVINIGTSTYNVGLGGLHSMEKSLVVVPKKGQTLGNVDVASYYPSLILALKLFPKQLTEAFLEVYAKIKKTRLEAKAKSKQYKKDGKLDLAEEFSIVNESLKIVLNGSFGKYGSKYSFLYAPDLLLQITLTGQLYLLMLIESLENNEFKVVSSNTDGVEILYKSKKQAQLEKIVSKWEKRTEMDMEYGYYRGLYARDVNNYIAVYEDEVKAKGVYADPTLPVNLMEKNSEYPIVFEAIRTFLFDGTPMKETIDGCKDVAQFCSSTTVSGGGVYSYDHFPNTEEYDTYVHEIASINRKQNKALEKRNEKYQKDLVLTSPSTKYLGKVVRFYYATNGAPIFRKKTGYKVGKTDGSYPMMELAEGIPKNLDYDKYYQLCDRYLKDLGWIGETLKVA